MLMELFGMFDISAIRHMHTYAFSPENPTGSRDGGSKGQDWEKLHPCIGIEPGKTLELINTDGPGIIRSMWFGGHISQHLILRIYWDHQDSPSVEVPLGAFFGYGYPDSVKSSDGRFPTLNSAMILVAPCRGMNCYWPMPFNKHCRMTLENRSPQDTLVTYYTITVDKGAIPSDSGYFHACYRQQRPVANKQAYTIIDNIEGEGHFAGVALFVGTNGANGCWVEGEAKFYIDGETYPSINYTGTEDYFCGSFAFGYDSELGMYQPYSGLYAGMYAVLGNDINRYSYQPRFMLYRWHIPDPICFQKSLRMTLQNMHFTPHGHKSRRDDYSSTAYWYQTKPCSTSTQLLSDEDIYIV